MTMWPSVLPFQYWRDKQLLSAVTILKSCEQKKKSFQKGKKKKTKDRCRISNSHAPSQGCRLSTSNKPWKTSFSTHNPGYASRSFPLYTFLSRGGYFYILTLGNHDKSSEESILGQTKPASASAAPLEQAPTGRRCHSSPQNHMLRRCTPHANDTKQNPRWL